MVRSACMSGMVRPPPAGGVLQCDIGVQFYKDLGLPELGYLFHCNRDFAMAEGFSSGIGLKRTQTIMEGASHCDFRFVRKN